MKALLMAAMLQLLSLFCYLLSVFKRSTDKTRSVFHTRTYKANVFCAWCFVWLVPVCHCFYHRTFQITVDFMAGFVSFPSFFFFIVLCRFIRTTLLSYFVNRLWRLKQKGKGALQFPQILQLDCVKLSHWDGLMNRSSGRNWVLWLKEWTTWLRKVLTCTNCRLFGILLFFLKCSQVGYII